MIIADHIGIILDVTGAITGAVVLQFFFPEKVLHLLSKQTIRDEAGLFYARHWGLLAFAMGGLLLYAAGHAEARAPIMLFAAIEKAGLVGLIALHAKRPYTQGMRLAAVFDGICVLVYAIYLAGIV
jgi:hypothetical protein